MLVLLAAVALLAVGGCTGGEQGTATTTPSPTSSGYGPNAVPDLCDAVSRGTLVRLSIRDNNTSGGGECNWYESTDVGDTTIRSSLIVDYGVHVPGSPDDDAEQAFEDAGSDLEEDPNQRATPVRGLGDEAKVYRRLGESSLDGRSREVKLVVREANVVIDVTADVASELETHRDRVSSFDTVESGTLTAMREMLGELTGSRVPPPKRSAYQQGEVEKVRSVCGSVDTARRMLPGARHRDLSEKGATLAGACSWQENESYGSRLDVHVEAIAPSRTTSESASKAADVLHGQLAWASTKRRGLGDEARSGDSSYRGGERRSLGLSVRRGNLLISIDYEKDGYPSKKRMERDVVRVAEEVLAANR